VREAAADAASKAGRVRAAYISQAVLLDPTKRANGTVLVTADFAARVNPRFVKTVYAPNGCA
jgi:hypothetical protein